MDNEIIEQTKIQGDSVVITSSQTVNKDDYFAHLQECIDFNTENIATLQAQIQGITDANAVLQAKLDGINA